MRRDLRKRLYDRIDLDGEITLHCIRQSRRHTSTIRIERMVGHGASMYMYEYVEAVFLHFSCTTYKKFHFSLFHRIRPTLLFHYL